MIQITKRTSTLHTTPSPWRKIKYIAIHYTAGVTSKPGAAANAANWFQNPKAQGSADFIVDDATIVQYNPDLDNRYCWAVGDSKKSGKGGRLYGVATNQNSVSIEICSTNRTGKITAANDANWSFTDAALERAVELTRYLMQKYNIGVERVVRHFDISGKNCPGVIGWNANTGDESKWIAFRQRLEEAELTKEEVRAIAREEFTVLLEKQNTLPADNWAEPIIEQAKELGITANGERPRGFLTRQEGAAMAVRAYESAVQAIQNAANAAWNGDG